MPLSNSIIPFTAPIKLYVFKEENTVSLNFRISDSCVHTDKMSIAHFEQIASDWKIGVSGLETWMGKVWWEYRKCGPRPEQIPAEFVAISFSNWHFSISVSDMEDLVAEFELQQNNVNMWDVDK